MCLTDLPTKSIKEKPQTDAKEQRATGIGPRDHNKRAKLSHIKRLPIKAKANPVSTSLCMWVLAVAVLTNMQVSIRNPTPNELNRKLDTDTTKAAAYFTANSPLLAALD